MEEMESIRLPLNGTRGKGKYTLTDGDYDGEWFNTFKWYVNNNGYVYTNVSESGIRRTIFLHKLVCKTPRGKWADHINRDKLDNRSCNLRPVTPSENRLNSKDLLGTRLTPEEIRRRANLYNKNYKRKPVNKAKKAVYDKKRYWESRDKILENRRRAYREQKSLTVAV